MRARRRKRRLRLWGAMAMEAAKAAEEEEKREQVASLSKRADESKSLRCPRCGKKLAEANRNGIIAGSFKCRNCKKVTVI